MPNTQTNKPWLPKAHRISVPNATIGEDGTFRVPKGEQEIYEKTRLDEIPVFIIQPIEWLWPRYVPRGKLTVIDGPEASGKSFVALDLAARVTRGSPFPGPVEGPQLPGDVIMVCEADELDDTFVPRLVAMQADFERLRVLAPVVTFDPLACTRTERRLSFPADLGHLEFEIRNRPETKLVVIDPLANFCKSERDFQETVRGLRQVAERCQVAIVAVTRSLSRRTPRPGRVAPPERRLDPARCVYSLAFDETDPARRFLAPARMGYRQMPGWLPFRIDAGRVLWDRPLTGEPELASSPETPAEKAGVLAEVTAWVAALLRDGDVSAKVLARMAAECGYSRITLQRARKKLGVRTYKKGYDTGACWLCTLRPEEEAAEAEDGQALPNAGENGQAAEETGEAQPERDGIETKSTPGRKGAGRIERETQPAAARKTLPADSDIRRELENLSPRQIQSLIHEYMKFEAAQLSPRAGRKPRNGHRPRRSREQQTGDESLREE